MSEGYRENAQGHLIPLDQIEEIIDECLREWSASSPGELRIIVDQAFRVDKEGRINTGAILSLRRLNSRPLKTLQRHKIL